MMSEKYDEAITTRMFLEFADQYHRSRIEGETDHDVKNKKH